MRHPPRGGQRGKRPKPEKVAPSIRLKSAGVNSKEWAAHKGTRVGTRPRVRGHEGPGVGTRARVGFRGGFPRVATPVLLPSTQPGGRPAPEKRPLGGRGHQRVDGNSTPR